MKPPKLFSMILALLAGGPALAQLPRELPPAPASAAETASVAAPAVPAPPGGPAIKIDPSGFNGGAGPNAFSGIGAIVLDPLAGAAASAPVLAQTSAGTDAALRASSPGSLAPAPAAEAYPFCRNPNDQRCRARPGTRVAP